MKILNCEHINLATIRIQVEIAYLLFVFPSIAVMQPAHVQWLPSGDVPNAHRAVAAARNQTLAVGRELNASNVSSVSAQAVDKAFDRDVPNSDSVIFQDR